MESYFIDWANLIIRLLHLVTGIAWIGASFYFIWLDNSLQNPPQWKQDKGIKGDLWAIHGGGIYEVSKYRLQPEQIPTTLHWFKWEAYATWLSGMALLVLIYYLGAEAYLIDPSVAQLSQIQAIAIGLAFIGGSWVAYALLCASPLAKNGYFVAVILALGGTSVAFALSHLFSGRGAYIHFGAIIGTLMVGNVFWVIIPSQKALVDAIERGVTPEPHMAQKAKLHSTHNTYLTVPLLFIMISGHFPMTYAHSENWLILIAIVLITALARHFFILRHHSRNVPQILVLVVFLTLCLAALLAPRSATTALATNTSVSPLAGQAVHVLQQRCSSCHSANPTDDVFTVAPGGVILDTEEEMRRWAQRIKARSVDTVDMPFMNKTQMTQQERDIISQWIADGMPTE